MVLGDLVAQARLEHGDAEFFLAEQRQLAAVFQAEEVGQLARADAFSAGGSQQHPVEVAEPGWVVAEHGTGQHIPAAAVGAGAVQVGHLR